MAPIVFTSAKAAGSRKPGDWGGIIVIGNGISNRSGTVLTEGPQGITEPYSGGTDNADNSGTLRYVRIEFAGYDVSAGAGQELNSLSLYAVGSRAPRWSTCNRSPARRFVRVVGWAVDGRYRCFLRFGDDHFDWTEGYRGQNQFLMRPVRPLDPDPGTGVLLLTRKASRPTAATALDVASASPSAISYRVCQVHDGRSRHRATLTARANVGMVLRRGTGGYLTNGIVRAGSGRAERPRSRNQQHAHHVDSLNGWDRLLAENALNYTMPLRTNFGKAAAFALDNHVGGGGHSGIAVCQTYAGFPRWTRLRAPCRNRVGPSWIPWNTPVVLRWVADQHYVFRSRRSGGHQVVAGLDQLRNN